MNTKIKLNKKHSISQLKKAIKDSRDERQKTRLRAIISIKNGSPKAQVAKEFVTTRTTVISWVKAYNKGGVGALSMSKGGRPEGNPVWDTKIFHDLVKEVNKQEKCWSVPLMQQWIKKKKNEDIPESTIWYHLQQLEYSYKSLRPHPYKANQKEYTRFKKRGS